MVRPRAAESLGPNLSPADVAGKPGIRIEQLYTWRRRMVSLCSAASALTWPTPFFVAVELIGSLPTRPSCRHLHGQRG